MRPSTEPICSFEHHCKCAEIAGLFGRPAVSPDSRAIDAALARLRTRFRAAGLELPVQVVHNAGFRLSQPIDLA